MRQTWNVPSLIMLSKPAIMKKKKKNASSDLITSPHRGSLVGNYHTSLFNVPNVHETAKTCPRSLSLELKCHSQRCNHVPAVPNFHFLDRSDKCVCVNGYFTCAEVALCFCSCGMCMICKSMNWKESIFIFKDRDFWQFTKRLLRDHKEITFHSFSPQIITALKWKALATFVISDDCWRPREHKQLGFNLTDS